MTTTPAGPPDLRAAFAELQRKAEQLDADVAGIKRGVQGTAAEVTTLRAELGRLSARAETASHQLTSLRTAIIATMDELDRLHPLAPTVAAAGTTAPPAKGKTK